MEGVNKTIITGSVKQLYLSLLEIHRTLKAVKGEKYHKERFNSLWANNNTVIHMENSVSLDDKIAVVHGKAFISIFKKNGCMQIEPKQ